MDRNFLLLGAVAGFLGVALGAFGAHGLRGRLPRKMLAVFETGVRYTCTTRSRWCSCRRHDRMSGWLLQTAGWSFVAGIVLFSGSLYALAIGGVTALGAVTPIGGLAFLIGWALPRLRGDLRSLWRVASAQQPSPSRCICSSWLPSRG